MGTHLRAIQWIPTRQGSNGFQKTLYPCHLDKSRVSIGRVKACANNSIQFSASIKARTAAVTTLRCGKRISLGFSQEDRQNRHQSICWRNARIELVHYSCPQTATHLTGTTQIEISLKRGHLANRRARVPNSDSQVHAHTEKQGKQMEEMISYILHMFVVKTCPKNLERTLKTSSW